MRDAFVQALTELAERDDKVLLLTADLGFGIFDDFRAQFANQFLNVGIAEQNMIGIATGLSLSGFKVFAYSIGNFSTLRCLEQIRNDAAYHNANLTVVASGGGFTYGPLGMSHHATEDIAIMRSLPNVSVIVPSSAYEAGAATRELYSTAGVSYLRLEKGGQKEPYDDSPFQIGKASIVEPGSDITIITCGGIMDEAVEASEFLKRDGVSVELISMHTVKPIDTQAIVRSIEKTGKLLVVEEHNIYGGLTSAVAEVVALNNLNVKMGAIALKDKYSSVVGTQKFLRDYYHMASSHIRLECLNIINL